MAQKKHLVILLLLLIVSILFKVHRLSDRYTFDWDQEDDAVKVMSIWKDHKPTLIGPRVAGPDGFFVGPFHYYFLTPFFALTKGDPITGAWIAVFIGVMTALVYYWISYKLTKNVWASTIAGLIVASDPRVVCWNVMYQGIIAILGYYLLIRSQENNRLFLMTCLFLGWASSTHLVPASLIPIFLIGWLLSKNKPKTAEIVKGIAFFSVFYIPLIAFEIRHDFLNIHKILALVNSDNQILDKWLFIKSFWRSLALDSNLNPGREWFMAQRIAALFGLAGIIGWTKDGKNKLLTTLWIILPIVVLSKYSGNIPEYYFNMVAGLIPLGIGLILSKNLVTKFVSVFLLVIIFQNNYIHANETRPLINLGDKEKIVDYLVKQKDDIYFNVSYDLPMGRDTGFEYLFMFKNRLPTRTEQGHLYTISLVTKDTDHLVFSAGKLFLLRR